MKAIIERILSTGGNLFEERGGRVLVKDTDLAEKGNKDEGWL